MTTPHRRLCPVGEILVLAACVCLFVCLFVCYQQYKKRLCYRSETYRINGIMWCHKIWSQITGPENDKYDKCDKNLPAIADMFSAADDQLFERVNRNSNHVLEPYLPAKRECCYSLRSQSHERTLINKTTELSERDYIVRVLYKYSY